MKDIRTYIYEGFKLGKNKVKKEDDYVDLELPSGTLWCKYNVGATCGYTPESWYGNYFMWGDTEPATNKKCNWTNYKYANGPSVTKYCPIDITKLTHFRKQSFWGGKGEPDDKIVLDLEDDMANANMGGDWVMPTKDDIQELIKYTTNKWTTDYKGISGLNGILFISKKNDNELFIPAAGYRSGNLFRAVGSTVRVWTSSVDIYYPIDAYDISFNKGKMDHNESYRRYNGKPIRGVLK